MAESTLEHLKLANLGQLSGKIALVTGGGTGIGLMIAKGLAANGAKVYISGRREEVLQDVCRQFPSMISLKMDVCDKDSIAHAAKVVEEKEGKLDVLVNNAGIAGSASYPFRKSLLEGSESVGEARWNDSYLFKLRSFEDWSEILKANTIAPFFVTMGFLDLLKKGARPGGASSVIMISSVGGKARASNNSPAYNTSKAAIDNLTTNLATEFAMNGIPIRVNSISPGFFQSEIMPAAFFEKVHDAVRSGIPFVEGTGPVPMRRFGT
ncbi:hypothetical protein VNI00_012830 [Paramarasmius palmivorus]|uniref:NAD(P)-binding protein n=1 Tax=Paramarasmius palmivorus TaxID=297713 RepID=A0AAW0C660_9AGAR